MAEEKSNFFKDLADIADQLKETAKVMEAAKETLAFTTDQQQKSTDALKELRVAATTANECLQRANAHLEKASLLLKQNPAPREDSAKATDLILEMATHVGALVDESGKLIDEPLMRLEKVIQAHALNGELAIRVAEFRQQYPDQADVLMPTVENIKITADSLQSIIDSLDPAKTDRASEIKVQFKN